MLTISENRYIIKKKGGISMYTYYFEDLETGENFFVECETIPKAIDIAETYFRRPRFLGIVSTEWAEIMGFDTY